MVWSWGWNQYGQVGQHEKGQVERPTVMINLGDHKDTETKHRLWAGAWGTWILTTAQ